MQRIYIAGALICGVVLVGCLQEPGEPWPEPQTTQSNQQPSTTPEQVGSMEEGPAFPEDNQGEVCITPTVYYQDADADGFGNGDVVMEACVAPEGYVTIEGDCADDNADVFPGQTAFFTEPYTALDGDSFDYNCDGVESLEYGDAECEIVVTPGEAPSCGAELVYDTCGGTKVTRCIRVGQFSCETVKGDAEEPGACS